MWSKVILQILSLSFKILVLLMRTRFKNSSFKIQFFLFYLFMSFKLNLKTIKAQ